MPTENSWRCTPWLQSSLMPADYSWRHKEVSHLQRIA